ncbi:MAG TPA: hypothetical protein VFA90_17915 [Terriglobales bacterium]|nr:hypothetical protein [Terriglobales bacterium]
MKFRASFVIAPLFCCFCSLAAISAVQDQAASGQAQENNSSTQSAPEPQKPDQTSTQAPATPQAPATEQSKSPGQKSSAPGTVPSPEAAHPGNSSVSGKQAGAPPKPPILRHKKAAMGKKASHTVKKKADPESADAKSTAQPNKVVVRNGGVSGESAQIAPAVTPDQAQHERASTAELLAATDANLQRVSGRRQLTRDEQSTVGEIRTYMRQAKAASTAGDTNRAQTLAYKARLLSDELARK